MSARDSQSPSQDSQGRSYASPSSDPSESTASDLLLGAYDPTKLHPLAELGDKLDYLLLEDDKIADMPGAHSAIPSRGWSDDLCYGTGSMYLSGVWRFFFLLFILYIAMSFPLLVALLPRKGLSLTLSSWSPYSSYCFLIILIMCSYRFKVWPLVVCGVYVKVPEGLWLCRAPDCGSTASLIPSQEEVLL